MDHSSRSFGVSSSPALGVVSERTRIVAADPHTDSRGGKLEGSTGEWDLPRFEALPRWFYETPPRVMVQGMDVMVRSSRPPQPAANETHGAVATGQLRGAVDELEHLPLATTLARSEEREPSVRSSTTTRREPVSRRRKHWLPAHRHRRAGVAANGHALFAPPPSTDLSYSQKRARDRSLEARLAVLEAEFEDSSNQLELFPMAYDYELGRAVPLARHGRKDASKSSCVAYGENLLGREAAEIREMRDLVRRNVNSPWLPGLGRRAAHQQRDSL